MNNKDRIKFLDCFVNGDIKGFIEILKKYFNSPSKDYFLKFVNGSYETDKSKETNNYLNAIRTDSIWFSSPSTFNDPFDCLYNIDLYEPIRNMVSEMPNTELNVPPEEDTKACREFQKALNEFFNDYLRENTALYPHGFVSCLFEFSNLKSLKMWSHYANSHKGFCIRYTRHDIANIPDSQFFPVAYKKEHTLSTKKDTQNAFSRILVKSTEWSYEKEWRVIKDNPDNESGKLISGIKADAIYIGCKADKKLRKELRKICREKGIKLYQMNIKPGTFSLYAQRIKLRRTT